MPRQATPGQRQPPRVLPAEPAALPERALPDVVLPEPAQPDRAQLDPAQLDPTQFDPARFDRAQPERVAPVTTGEPDDDAAQPIEPGKPRHRAAGSGRVPLPTPAGQNGKRIRKPRTGRRRRSAFWKELPLLVVVALMLTFLIQTFLAKVYVIPSGSMKATLHGCTGCVNDRVVVDKMVYRFGNPGPGDVVVFRGPDGWVNTEFTVEKSDNFLLRGLQGLGSLIGLAPPDEKDFVKRVIATGGQTVACCDSRNRVQVDGKPLDEPYLNYPPELGPPRQVPFGPIRIPNGQLWVMGDNRNNSADSRAQGHGAVPTEFVVGKARWIVLPFSRLSEIPDPNPQLTAAAGLPGPGSPDTAAPALAFGMLGAVPLAVARRRRASTREQLDPFLAPPLALPLTLPSRRAVRRGPGGS